MRKLHNNQETMDIIARITKMKEDTIAKKQLDGLINAHQF